MTMRRGRVLLVAYSGYPEVNSTWLHLDNGLAQLAGSLVAVGHAVKIKDLQTLTNWEKLFPYEVAARRSALLQEFDDAIHSGNAADMSGLVARARELDDEIVARNSKVVASFADDIAAEFANFAPDVVGFKLWAQSSLVDQLELARRLRLAYPNALFVGGGPGAELLGEAVLRRTDVFHALVYGPGETALTRLVDMKISGVVDLARVPSLIYPSEAGLARTERADPKLTEGVHPCYERGVYVDWDEKIHNVHIESDRGCNFKCTFCIHPHKSGRQQKKPVEQFMNELEKLNAEYGFSYFHLAGSDPSFRHMEDISREVIGRGRDFGFMGFQSLRVLDEEGVGLLAQANFDRIWVGIESGDERITIDLAKGRRKARLWERAALVRRSGIAITGSVITPCPGEGEGSVDANIATLRAVQPDVTLIYPPLVQPKSPWFQGNDQLIVLEDRDRVEDLYVQHGSEWHPGNRVLPPPFYCPDLAESIRIEGRPYTEAYTRHAVNSARIMRQVSNRLSVAQFGDRSRHRSKLKRLYFKSQVSVCSAIRTGAFDKARQAVAEYNAFVQRGGYLAA